MDGVQVSDSSKTIEAVRREVGMAADGMTMICVIHVRGFAQQVADRVIFMAKREIIEQAEPGVFFRSPQHQRTRDFLGQILIRH